MKTILAYALGFSMTFTVIAGGMYFLSEKYPWMFGQSDAQAAQNSDQRAAAPRPGLSARGTRRSDTTACSALASENRISSCWCGG